jgi:transketolase C-terminal domain/subunit
MPFWFKFLFLPNAETFLQTVSRSGNLLGSIHWDVNAASSHSAMLLVFCENAQTAGGLGSAAAEYLCEQEPVRILKIGIQDEFGEVGTLEYLKTRYGLTAKAMTGRILEILKKGS